MLKTTKLLVLLACFFAVANSLAAGLFESDVKILISEVDDAINRLDAQAIADRMSEDVQIVMNITVQGQTQILKPSKAEYISMLQQGWAVYSNYDYDRSNVEIKIVGDQALVTADVNESMTVQGQTISVSSKEEVVIEIVNGVPLITKAVGYTTM